MTLAEGLRLVAPIEAGAGARAVYEPRGVLAVLGPFNFPAHLPNGHIAPALATGNCVVFKPSERTPAVGHRIAELWRRAGLPEGVLELVQGGAETGRLLATHGGVDGLLFTGSWAVGRSLQQACLDQPGKLLALELGGKNAIVVLDDAELDLAVAETALSIAATTGQRCSCASRIFVQRGIEDAFVDKLIPVLTGLRVGNPLDAGVFMGPLIDGAAHERLRATRAPSCAKPAANACCWPIPACRRPSRAPASCASSARSSRTRRSARSSSDPRRRCIRSTTSITRSPRSTTATTASSRRS